jgi:crotonobetainyl-CoA:carnitine CoA-transferase CaiB-like acyl-CoA transferase
MTRSNPGLQGIRILDLTHVWAGPLGTRILADLGAEVIKIEAPFGRGPATIPPGSVGMFQGDPGDEAHNHQALFNKLNRNKQSVAIDLKSAAGRDLFLALVGQADVVIENFSARAMKSLRLDYDHLRRVNPGIIYVAMPGYGTFGPQSDYVAFGPSVELMTGLTTLLGYSQDEPRATSMALPDAMAGVTAAAALITALLGKQQTGVGGFIDLALHEAATALLGEHFVEYQLTGASPSIIGNRHRFHCPQGIYPCLPETFDHSASGYIAIACRTDDEWLALSRFAARGWHVDSRFQSRESRKHNEDALDAEIGEFTRQHEKLALMRDLQAAGIPAGAVMVVPELMADVHNRFRGYFVELGNRGVPAIPFPGSPTTVDGNRHANWHGAPRLGEHNESILRDLLGYSDGEIERLTNAGVLARRPTT